MVQRMGTRLRIGIMRGSARAKRSSLMSPAGGRPTASRWYVRRCCIGAVSSGGTPGPRAQQGSSPAGSAIALWPKGVGARFLIEIMRVRIAPGLPFSLRDRLKGRTAGSEPGYGVAELPNLGRGSNRRRGAINRRGLLSTAVRYSRTRGAHPGFGATRFEP